MVAVGEELWVFLEGRAGTADGCDVVGEEGESQRVSVGLGSTGRREGERKTAGEEAQCTRGRCPAQPTETGSRGASAGTAELRTVPPTDGNSSVGADGG